MEFSARIKNEAERYGVPPQTLVMTDLMAIGYSEEEAYNIAYSTNMSFSAQQNKNIRKSITGNEAFPDMLEDRKRAVQGLAGIGMTNPDIRPQYSKEEIASKLRAQIDMLADGTKEKTDALMKYADLFAYKKEEKKADEEDVIRVWLPLTCDICPYKKKGEGK